jgi:hypothetical protein
MVGLGRRVRKRQRRLRNRPVRLGLAASVLAQVLLPGRNAEDLDELVRSLSVPLQLPTRPSSLESRPVQMPPRLQECRLPLRRDGVVDVDQNGSGVGLRVEGQPSVGPVISLASLTCVRRWPSRSTWTYWAR